MTYQTIQYQVEDGIATITLNRPQALNAYNPVMMQDLIDAFDAADGDDAVRAVIVTGAGRAFCAGADISGGTDGFVMQKEMPRLPDGSIDVGHPDLRDGGGRLTLRIFECLKPVIAAINGVAVGIGATMTLPMDIRLCSDKARFGFVFSRRGIVPEAASSFFLPRIVGISRSLQWCYSGRIFDANEALSGGLVQSVVPEDQLLSTARTLAKELVEHSAPVSVSLTRQLMWRGLTLEHPMDAHQIDSRLIVSRSNSGDAAEGVTSFLEKRPARFPDRVSSDMPAAFPWWSERTYR
jgi:enoyl-CoA hydratase/carnithine racemase